MKDIKITWYRTARQCFAAFCCCKVSEIPLTRWRIFYDQKGVLRKLSDKTSYKNIMKRGCWGWCEDKSIIHLWVSKRASQENAVRLIAHELGHCQSPHYKSHRKEEIKAGRYEDVIAKTLDILNSR